MLDSNEYADTLQQLNSFLLQPEEVARIDKLIRVNKDAIKANYDAHSYRRRLIRTYRSVTQTPVEQQIDKTVLLAEFLKLPQFSLLKWCDYVEEKNCRKVS